MLRSQENAKFFLGALQFFHHTELYYGDQNKDEVVGGGEGVNLTNLPARNYKCLQHFGFIYFGLLYCVVL